VGGPEGHKHNTTYTRIAGLIFLAGWVGPKVTSTHATI